MHYGHLLRWSIIHVCGISLLLYLVQCHYKLSVEKITWCAHVSVHVWAQPLPVLLLLQATQPLKQVCQHTRALVVISSIGAHVQQARPYE